MATLAWAISSCRASCPRKRGHGTRLLQSLIPNPFILPPKRNVPVPMLVVHLREIRADVGPAALAALLARRGSSAGDAQSMFCSSQPRIGKLPGQHVARTSD